MVITPARLAEVRVDGAEKLTGAATYASDITRAGMLWAKALRSPFPHARIVSIDVSQAQALPGVHCVLTGRDIPDCRVGRSMRDMPVLAGDVVRFVGEKVAAVAADDPETAEEALTLIDVEYGELPAVFDPLEAVQPGAPLVHDPDEVRAQATPAQKVADYPNSVCNPIWGASVGEIEAAFAEADHVFEHTFHTPIQHQAYIEPHSCLVELNDAGVAHIWASNKAPFLLLNYLRNGLGLTREQLVVHLLPLGGDFGGKGSFMDIPLVYFLAKETGRPVKMLMSYTEELLAGNPRHSATVIVRSGFDRNGKLLARWTRSYYNSGAYAAFKPSPDATLPRIKSGGLGPYEIPLSRVEGHMVYTHTVPGGHMRAPGGAQPILATECHMDLCAREMGIDPLDLRLINAPTEPRHSESGEMGSTPKSREVLRAAADAIGWPRRRPGVRGPASGAENLTSAPDSRPPTPPVGRGIALIEIHNSPADGYTARMMVEPDGQVVLHTPIIENGAGALTAFRLLTAEAMGIPPEQVEVEQTMEDFDYDRGVGGSRITRIVGKMIATLGQRMQTRLAALVAARFGYDDEEVGIEPGGFRTPDGQLHSIVDAASLSPVGLSELLRYEVDPADTVEAYAAIASQVGVDRETGGVEVKRVAAAFEVGRIVNSIMYQGQIDGGLTQGLGYALMEGLTFEEGRITKLNLHEYKLPTAADVPPLQTILLPPDLSLGITPIGEGPNCGIAPSIVNAIVDVVGHQVEIPVSPEDVILSETKDPPSRGTDSSALRASE